MTQTLRLIGDNGSTSVDEVMKSLNEHPIGESTRGDDEIRRGWHQFDSGYLHRGNSFAEGSIDRERLECSGLSGKGDDQQVLVRGPDRNGMV